MLTVCTHSDAAWDNAKNHGTQAGLFQAFTHKHIHDAKEVAWNPVAWKSYRLPRAVASTLAGEAQALACATGTTECLSLMLGEALDGSFDLRDTLSVLRRRQAIAITDCKSLYDHVTSLSTPSTIADRRCAIDVAIIRESVARTRMSVR